MNKQKLIEKIKNLKHHVQNKSWVDRRLVLNLIEQLDEPQKPVVPQFVADWIEEVKPAYTLFAAMEYGNLKIDKWLGNNSNQETFALAWIFGYEVEKEKKYRVVMPNISSSGGVLTRIKHDDSWIWIDTLGTIIEGRTHTRKKLEDAGFGWVFDCPGIEVREVEE